MIVKTASGLRVLTEPLLATILRLECIYYIRFVIDLDKADHQVAEKFCRGNKPNILFE